MNRQFKIAVVGATGNVGMEMLNILSERNFPYKEVIALASENSIGKEVSFGEYKTLKVQSLNNYDFKDTDIALFSPGSEISAKYAPIAAAANCIVIDNTSYFRMNKDIPLIIPEINDELIKNFKKKNIIANPNCVAIQIALAIYPLHKKYGVKNVIISTYQSVSGAGKAAMDELFNQSKSLMTFGNNESKIFNRQIAFNVIPQIGEFCDDGDTIEEEKIISELQKIISPDINISVTCVRVPVFIGHGTSISVELNNFADIKDVKKILGAAEGVELICDDNLYITPKEAVNTNSVYVSRVRKNKVFKSGVNMWVVADNVRKGAALNAVQIAENLINIL